MRMKTSPKFTLGALVGALTVSAAFLNPIANAAPASTHLIVPGTKIGQLMLGPNGSQQLARLPQPQASDHGMQQTYMAWLSHATNNTLFVHTVHNAAYDPPKVPATGETILAINVTSPYFRTSQGISAGCTLTKIKKAFPHLKRTQIQKGSVIYDDTRSGIAFEFSKDSSAARCVSITVHPKSEEGGVSIQQVKELLANPA